MAQWKFAVGRPAAEQRLVVDDRLRNSEYVATLIAPKSGVPVRIVAAGHRLFGFAPNMKRVYAEGSFGEEEGGCVRQHMSPGILDPQDLGKAIGATMYVGGCLAANLDDVDCTFSVIGDRSRDADRAWENLVENGLATEGEVRGQECGSMELDDYLADAVYLDYLTDVDHVEFDPSYVEWCAEGSRDGNQIDFPTAINSGLVLHSVESDVTAVASEVYSRDVWLGATEPGEFAKWVNWAADGDEAYVMRVVDGLRDRGAKGRFPKFAAAVRQEWNSSDHGSRRQLKLDWGSERGNPGRKPGRSRGYAKWLKAYGPKSKWP